MACLFRGDAELGGFTQQGADEVGPKLFGAGDDQSLPSSGCYKHSYSSPLVENAVFDQTVDALVSSRRIDAVKGREFVGRRNGYFFLKDAINDVVLDLLRDLHEDRFARFDQGLSAFSGCCCPIPSPRRFTG